MVEEHAEGPSGLPPTGRAYLCADSRVPTEPPVGIEPTTFSLRGRTTPSHPLSTSASSNKAVPSAHEIPHAYPSFRATSHAMPLGHLVAVQLADHRGCTDSVGFGTGHGASTGVLACGA